MKTRMLTLGVLAAAGCATILPEAFQPRPRGIQSLELRAHIAELGSDRYEGRGPGTPGEELTVRYLSTQFQSLGLQPGNPDGTWVQEVPMVGIFSKPSVAFVRGETRMQLDCPGECVAFSRRFTPDIDVKADEVLFVGYGVDAPEYGWDDYKGVDVRGKVIVMLVNDPPVADSHDPSRLDERVFEGKAMTYFGRWTYKYEIAARKQAAAVLLVHEEGPAGYPFGVVQSSWTHENFDLADAGGNVRRAPVEGWLRQDKAKELFSAGGLDFEELKRQAATREFKPVAFKELRAELRVHNDMREIRSRNVVARLPGSDPLRKDEYVVYTAHWDHLGRDDSLPNDKIYNGAVDNASGVAGLLEIAAAFRDPALAPPPRSVLFLATTAEEKGLLGARWYAEHPLYPLEKTLCDINMDSLNPFGRTRDLISVGLGRTTIDAQLEDLLHRHGRVLRGDSEPEKGYYYRSDHFEFARAGVPAVYADGGVDLIGAPSGEGKRLWTLYTRERYHKPGDELRDEWDLAGAVEDVELLYELGRTIATEDAWPAWKPGSEFRATRLAQLAGGARAK
ncbi:MAG: M28 family peptidase [Planctomycetes bacterium]|nr:M28 family peptidase [Planctomycetota bacterium]